MITTLLEASRGTSLWVLWLLVILSIWVSAIIIERWLSLRKRLPELEKYTTQLRQNLAHPLAADWHPAELANLNHLYTRLWQKAKQQHATTLRAELDDELLMQEKYLLKGVSILGTLGANTPFIGLLGTVLGVMEAFAKLGTTTASSANVGGVMAGISEALIATGFGLLVAIPCVLSYNYFQRRVRFMIGQLRTLGLWLIAVGQENNQQTD